MNIRTTLTTIGPLLGISFLSIFIHSCTDDELFHPQLSDDKITIQASVSDLWLPGGKSRGGENESHGTEVTNGYKIESESAAEPLYIFESVSDRFETKASEQSKPQSRGAVVGNQTSFEKTIMGVYAYYTHHTEQPFYMENIPYGKSGNYWKSQGAEYLWPVSTNDENQLQFFAYSPYNAKDSNGNSLIDINKEDGNVNLHYIVPDNIDDQPDLLISNLTDIRDISAAQKNGVELDLHHALTSIRFVSDKMYPGTVTKISIRNIKNEGDLDLNTGIWNTNEATLHDFSFKCKSDIGENNSEDRDYLPDNPGLPGHENDSYSLLGTELETLMMVPQSSKNNDIKPVLEIEYTDKTQTNRRFIRELDIDWKPGQSIVYRISTSNMHTEVTFEVSTYKGDNNERKIYACGNENADESMVPITTVASYYTLYEIDDNENIVNRGSAPLPWKMEYGERTENNTTLSTTWGNNDWFKTKIDPEISKGIFGVSPLVSEIPIRVGASNKGRTEEITPIRQTSHTGVVDLSLQNGTRNTANCYIVSGPGTYMIPLVYGNAIKNGDNNEDAYICTQTVDQGTVLKRFLNHAGQEIRSPWIEENLDSDGAYIKFYDDNQSKKTINASIIWYQSVNGLDQVPIQIDNQLKEDSKGHKYLQFNVSSISERANAIIAVYNSKGQLVWDWHIWITDTFVDGIKTFPTRSNDGVNYELMQTPLGFIPGRKAIYQRRYNVIRFSQLDPGANNSGANNILVGQSGKENVIVQEYEQEGYESDEYDECLYYQYGNKNPLASYYSYKFESSNHSHQHVDTIISRRRTLHNVNSIPIIENGSTNIKSLITGMISNPYTSYRYSPAQVVHPRNMWNNNTVFDGIPVKTIYDPCPPGFMVPCRIQVSDSFRYDGDKTFDQDNYRLNLNLNGYIFTLPRSFTFTVSDGQFKRLSNERMTYLVGHNDGLVLRYFAFLFKDESQGADPYLYPEYNEVRRASSAQVVNHLGVIIPMKEL